MIITTFFLKIIGTKASLKKMCKKHNDFFELFKYECNLSDIG